MHKKPCKQHLTLLDVNAKCPVCGWAAGDHPTHPSNREPRIYNEAANLRREVAELRAERSRVAGVLAVFLTSEAFELTPFEQGEDGATSRALSVLREDAEALDGTVEMRLTDRAIVLTFIPK